MKFSKPSPLSLFLLAMSTSGGAYAGNCTPGTYSSTGQDTAPGGCIPAPVGTYVSTPGATVATPAAAGYYAPITGLTAALMAPVGSYVPGTGASVPTPAPVGSYAPVTGLTAALLAPVGHFVPSVGAVVAIPAGPGTYAPTTGMSVALQAPVGTYVANSGASAPTLAPAGSYVPTTGQTAALLAPIGSYVPSTGASAPTLAPVGSYVSSTGQTAATLAPAGYFVAVVGAAAATPALPGTYAPTTGMSAPLQAPVGYYVSTAGATAATPAPVGSFVSTTGQTAAAFAPIGSYVASFGQSSATQASPGFYTYAPGASNQVPAGLMSGPINATIRANEASIRDASALIEDGNDATIKSSFYFQGGSVDQIGQSSGARQNISFWGLNLMGNLFGSKDEPAGIYANVSSANYSAGSDGSGNGLGVSLGIFKKLQWDTAKLIGTVVLGNYQYSNTRQNLSQGEVSGVAASNQGATGNTSVNIYGINALGLLPLTNALPNLDGFLNVAVTNYAYTGMNESATGANGNPSAGLNASSMNYVSVPATLGAKYYLMDSSNQKQLGAISIGYKYDFGKSSNLNLATQSAPSYQFGMPIALTNARATVIEISSANYELQKDLSLSAAISTEFSSNYSFYQGSIRLLKLF